MAADKKTAAREAYAVICKALDNRNWTYDKEEDKLLAHFRVSGEDLPMQHFLYVDEERQLIRMSSPLPFDMCDDKRMDGAIAACQATYGLSDGSFDYDLFDGKIVFRMSMAYHDSVIATGAIQYMIDFTNAVVDKYNDRFLALNKGLWSLQQFLEND